MDIDVLMGELFDDIEMLEVKARRLRALITSERNHVRLDAQPHPNRSAPERPAQPANAENSRQYAEQMATGTIGRPAE